jgi:hypothetical protein
VLNVDEHGRSPEENDRIRRAAEDREEALSHGKSAASGALDNAANVRLSGNPGLTRLAPSQVDRLEQGFQQPITDDRRAHRLYFARGILRASLPK